MARPIFSHLMPSARASLRKPLVCLLTGVLAAGPVSGWAAPAAVDAQLETALGVANERMHAQQFEGCVQALTPVLTAAYAQPGVIDFSKVERAQLLTGVCQYRAHDLVAAGATLLELYRLFPKNTAQAESYPAPFQRALAVAQVKAESLPKAQVNVVGPKGTMLWVDGQESGALPWSGRLPAGRHFFAAGPKGAAEPSEVPKDGTATVDLAAWDDANPALHPGAAASAKVDSPRVPWWVWVLGGAAVVGVGVGTYAVVSSSHSATGTVSATW